MAKITTKGMIEYQDPEGDLLAIKPEDLHAKAIRAGEAAALQCVPTPMVVVSHVNPLNDGSPVDGRWKVSGGVCGFASVHIRLTDKMSRRFINGLIKAGIASRDENAHDAIWRKHAYYGGFYYWVSTFTQSMEIKQAFAAAMVKELKDHGITAYMLSRED